MYLPMMFEDKAVTRFLVTLNSLQNILRFGLKFLTLNVGKTIFMQIFVRVIGDT